MSDDYHLVDQPLSFSKGETIGYTLSLRSRRTGLVTGGLGNWSALQGFLADKNLRVIGEHQLDFNATGCGYIDEGKSFLVKTAQLASDYGFGNEAGNIIAVKSLKPIDTQEKLENVCLEILALMHPPLQSHPNIINLLGLTWTTERDVRLEPALVMEYAEFGSLDNYLRSHPISILSKAEICTGIAQGLDVLYQCAIIHGDVKCENVLICKGSSGTDIIPKLSDFGFSLVLQNTQMDENVVGTSRWNAPEIFLGKLSELRKDPTNLPLLDIYSYGLLVWCVLKNGQDPFGDPSTVSTEHVLILKAYTNEPLNQACHDVRALRSGHHSDAAHLAAFENIFKETLPRDPSDRCRNLGWVADAFSLS